MTMRTWPLLTTAALTLVTTAGCAGDEPQTAVAKGPVRALVVDTDLASDDLVALAFLLSSPRAEIRAITVSGTGEVRCPAGLDVVRGLLELTHDRGIPVACGRTTPLVGDHQFPVDWRDAADDAWGLDFPAVEQPALEVSVTDLLARTLGAGDTTLLALGPLTNVAEAFRARPALPGKVRSVVAMGGAVDVPGNVLVGEHGSPAPAEWNMYADPTAAAEVVASVAPLTLVGLDATSHVPITGDFIEELSDGEGSEARDVVAELLAGNPMVASGEAYFWDPLTAATVLDPSLVRTETATLSVVTGDGSESGRTVRDADGAPVTVATWADAASLEALLLATLG